MKKSDLKTGMLAQCRNGEVHLVINDTLVEKDNEHLVLSSFNGNLLCEKDVCGNDEYSIIKVSKVLKGWRLRPVEWTEKRLNEELLWEREEEKMINIDGKEYSKSTIKKALKDYIGE